MQINKVDSGLLHSCMYIVEENDHAIIIDPCNKTDYADNLKVDFLIITHEHYDHISGVNEWQQITGAPLICSHACADCIKSSKKNMSRFFDVFCEMQTWMPIDDMEITQVEYSCEADIVFQNELSFEWQGHQVLLMEIPGHSLGSIGIDIDGNNFFSGDSLLENKEIELRFPGGSIKKWNEIGRKRIESIPDGMRIWPGHFDSFILRKPK